MSRRFRTTSHLPLKRRDVVRAGSVGLLGMSLPELLAAQSAASTRPGRAKACILLFMWGGPGHQDTWDLKPTGLRPR